MTARRSRCRSPRERRCSPRTRRGRNIVYETERAIEATAARLEDVYYVDPEEDQIRRLDLSQPLRLFTGGTGEELQRHQFTLGQSQVLRLDGPCRIAVEPREQVRYLEEESAARLAGEGLTWTFRHGGADIPFDAVRAEHGRVLLEKRSHLALEPLDEGGEIAISCQGRPAAELKLDQILLTSEPLEPCGAQSLFFRRPAHRPGGGRILLRPAARPPMASFTFAATAPCPKAGARASLHLEIVPIVEEPAAQPPQYRYGEAIIDKQGAVEVKPDDVWISGVTWEYFNGQGWRQAGGDG